MSCAKSQKRNAFTLIELMLSLAIMAMLLAALATAFNASIENYTANRDMARAINTARQAMLRITTDIRTAIVEISEPADSCSMITADNRDITYRYDSDDNELCMVVNTGTNAGTYLLCDNVTAMSFTRTAVEGDPTAVKDVQVSITVTCGDISQHLAAAATVRKNL